MSESNTSTRRAWLAATILALAASSISASATDAGAAAAPAFAASAPRHEVGARAEDHDRQECKHDWQRVSERKWIAPKKKKVEVGKDKNGKPIYQWREVEPGRWETEHVNVCRKCGKKSK